MSDGPAPIVLPVPDLGDDLVRLRPWRPDDAEVLAAAWRDPEIAAGSTPPADRTADGALGWIQSWDRRRLAGAALDLVVCDSGDGRVLGEVGLARFDPTRRAAMIGWWVAAAERGRGVASCAVGLVTDWVLDGGHLEAVVAEIGAGNDASVRVAHRCGFRLLRPAGPDGPAVYAVRRDSGSAAMRSATSDI